MLFAIHMLFIMQGCVDGSICVHRLLWSSPWLKSFESSSAQPGLHGGPKLSYGTLLSSSATQSSSSLLRSWSGLEVGPPVNSIEGLQSRLPNFDDQSSKPVPRLECVLLRAFKRGGSTFADVDDRSVFGA